jgi:hypothetical protein
LVRQRLLCLGDTSPDLLLVEADGDPSIDYRVACRRDSGSGLSDDDRRRSARVFVDVRKKLRERGPDARNDDDGATAQPRDNVAVFAVPDEVPKGTQHCRPARVFALRSDLQL